MPLAIADYMTSTWFTQTWIHCWMLQIKISTDTQDNMNPQKCDKEIMQIFIQHGITGHKLAAMNRCWMYLHAIFLSDICTGNGTAINSHYWDGKTYVIQTTDG